jgi:hypothetical protein
MFSLFNILHMPHIQKSLLFVEIFCRDNNIYFKFQAFVFYVKDFNTKSVLLSDQSKDGL